MRILVLDDSDERLKEFKQNFIGNIVDCVKTAREAINKLTSEKYECIYLDHDLGDRVFVPSGPGTGYEVAQWLNQNPDRQPQLIIIHSFNPVGAKNMKSLLPNAVIAPGVWTKLDGGLA